MKQNVNKLAFHDAFVACGRGDQFSYKGRGALFDYLTELEDDTGTEIELDVVALCCDYSEYSSATEAVRDHGVDWCPDLYDINEKERDEDEVAQEMEQYAIDWLRDRAQLIEFEGGIIVSSF